MKDYAFLKRFTMIVLTISVLFLGQGFVFQNNNSAYAYGDCSQYGYMATYDYLTDGCKCMSGYIWDKDFLGKDTCVSGNSVCYDKYGYGSKYDSLSGSCGCSYGYVFGKDSIGRTQCITENQSCQNQYGSDAQSAYGGNCECSYGYVIYNGSCTRGNTVCSLKNGINSEYDSLSNSCKCSSGYTLDEDSQCVEKQNNVYFTLKELDTDDRKAIVKSDYDYRYYLITYNSGCYAPSFRRYINHPIVINLGTDFDLDSWDKIVLQDDDETCDVARVERANSSTTLRPEEELEETFFIPNTTNKTTIPSLNISSITPDQPKIIEVVPKPVDKIKKEFKFEQDKKSDYIIKLVGELSASGALRKCPSVSECDVIKYFNPKTRVDILGSYDNKAWHRVSIMNDGGLVLGWMHSSLINQVKEKKDVGIEAQKDALQADGNRKSESEISDKKPEKATTEEVPWYKSFFKFLTGIFK